MNCWVITYRVAFGLVVLICIALLVKLFNPKIRFYNEMQGRKAELVAENRKQANEINELVQKQERFNSDPEFVERTAKEIGMVKSNEVVIKVSNENTPAPNRQN